MAKGKVNIYLKSGNTIVVGCTECKFTFNRETGNYDAYSIKDPDRQFGIALSQIEAWEYIK